MKNKISYEGMPFDHVNNNLKILKNFCADVKTQPNVFYINGDVDVNEILKRCGFLFNAKVNTYDEIVGLTYEECKAKIASLIAPYDVLNMNILHKNACLYIDPKIYVFDLDTMNLPIDIVISVLNDQLIFFTNDNKCIFICEQDCNPSIDAIKLILKGRLYDRVIAIERDLKQFDVSDYTNDVIMNLCQKMNANEFLCKYVYYDRHSRTVGEDLSLLGTISAIKFSDDRLRQIHKDGVFDADVMIVKCIMHLSNLLIYGLPSGNLDPFGVKKSADFIVNYLIDNSLNIPEIPKDMEEFLIKRLSNKIKGSDVLLCKQMDWKNVCNDRYIQLDVASINRIMKLVRKSSPVEHVELTAIESGLLILVNKLSYGFINDVVGRFIEYIDNNKVGLYFERIDLLEQLLNKIQSIIDLK
jgi:hypothetical protein